MLIDLVLLIVSIILLSKAAEFAVEQAEVVSDAFGISRIAIGFLLFSVITSLPELSVSVFASLMGSNGIVFGNVFSANILDALFVLGISALAYNGIKINREETNETATITIVASAITIYIILNALFGPALLGPVEGIALLGIFFVYAFFSAKKKKVEEVKSIPKRKALLSFVFSVLAIVVVLISAGFAVQYAVKVAEEFHLSEAFISATLFSFGTTLPELSVSLQATRKKAYGIAIGTCVGSILTNLTLVFGSALALNAMNVASINHVGFIAPFFMIPLSFHLLANAMLFYFAMRKEEISRAAGLLFIVLLAAYMTLLLYLQL